MSEVTSRLARLRVPLGFVFAIIVFLLAHPSAASLLTGGVIAACGEGLRVWASGHLNKSREVTASGPYRWFAHPLYVGSSIMGAGVGVASNSVLVVLMVAVYLGATITAAVRSEEAFLRGRFGDDYERYRRGRPDEPAVREPRRFRFAQAIANREYRAVAGLVAAILLLLWKATYNGTF